MTSWLPLFWAALRESSARLRAGGQSRNRNPDTMTDATRKSDTKSRLMELERLSGFGSSLPRRKTLCLLPVLFIDQTNWFLSVNFQLGQLVDEMQSTCAGHLWSTGVVVFTADRTERHRGKDRGPLKARRWIVYQTLPKWADDCKRCAGTGCTRIHHGSVFVSFPSWYFHLSGGCATFYTTAEDL